MQALPLLMSKTLPRLEPKVSVFNSHRRYRIGTKRVRDYVKRILGKRRADISIVFVDSHRCKSINRTFLGHNYVTDVISFCLETAPVLEGEIYVNLDRAKRQAHEYSETFTNEIARLVIHGTLHLIGYDDVNASDARKMKSLEDSHVRYWFTPQLRKERI